MKSAKQNQLAEAAPRNWKGFTAFGGLRFSAALRALAGALSLKPEPRNWREELRSVIGELNTLNRSSEADFLGISGNLMSFLSNTKKLHGLMRGVAATVDEGRAHQACEALVAVRGAVGEMRTRADARRQAMTTLRGEAGQIRKDFLDFGKTAFSFHITAILARIETAHLSRLQKDLGNLADEVRACSDGIQVRAVEVLEAARAFDQRVEETLARMARAQAVQAQELPQLMGAVDAELAAFSLAQKQSLAGAAALETDLDSMSNELGAIVAAVQFHDITRQRVEHVVAALEDILDDPAHMATHLDLAADEGRIVRLQMAQLAHASQSFEESGAKIDRELAGIAARVDTLSGNCQSTLGVREDESGSLLESMQARLDSVTRAVAESQSLESATVQMWIDLGGIATRLGEAIDGIQRIELQLHRLAINSSISACHIGPSANPLLVVAGAMQQLQGDCAVRSGAAATALALIRQAIEANSGASDQLRVASSRLFADLHLRIAELSVAAKSNRQTLGPICDLAQELRHHAAGSRGHEVIGQRFAEVAAQCNATLSRVLDEVPTGAAGPEDESNAARLSARYTMQSERDLHAEVFGACSASELAAVAATTESDDGVEFF